MLDRPLPLRERLSHPQPAVFAASPEGHAVSAPTGVLRTLIRFAPKVNPMPVPHISHWRSASLNVLTASELRKPRAAKGEHEVCVSCYGSAGYVMRRFLEFFSDVVVITLTAVSGYHFANEACEKKLEAKYHCNQCEIE